MRQPRVVVPLLHRHLDDAVFYWGQLEDPAAADHLQASHALDFAEFLDANLQGLRVAEEKGAQLGLDALKRWRKPGEAFAALYCALSAHDAQDRIAGCDAVFDLVARAPDLLLRGAISALAWAETAQAEPVLAHALHGEPVRRVAALRAHALRGLSVSNWSEQIQHENAFVRAAACRAVPKEALQALLVRRVDPDLVVRAESVLAWARLVPSSERGADSAAQAAGVLWRCVVDQHQLWREATGWHRVQAQRRLARWLRHLAWLAPLGHPGVRQLLAQLPSRLGLTFVLHHGDAEHLGFVLAALNQPESARWALWIWRCLTGVEPQAAGLTLPDPPVELDSPLTRSQLDADHGLPLPDVAAVMAHPASRLSTLTGQRLLMGRPVHPHLLRELLDPASNQFQALRFVAAHALEQLHPTYALNLRASAAVQALQLSRMGIAA